MLQLIIGTRRYPSAHLNAHLKKGSNHLNKDLATAGFYRHPGNKQFHHIRNNQDVIY